MPEDAEMTEDNIVAESADVVPEASAIAEESDGGRSIEVDEIEETNLVEETEDDLPCNSLSLSRLLASAAFRLLASYAVGIVAPHRALHRVP